MSRTPTEDDLARFVRNNVLCCLSSMVSTLASGYGHCSQRTRDYPHEELIEQAFELASPVYDYEEAAQQAGWEPYTDKFGVACWRDTKDDATFAGTVADLCEHADLEPYEREVFEFWAVDSWFAEKLIAQGEKVDTDFAGLCVWARTTSGQAISMDGVIKRIWRDLHKDDA